MKKPTMDTIGKTRPLDDTRSVSTAHHPGGQRKERQPRQVGPGATPHERAGDGREHDEEDGLRDEDGHDDVGRVEGHPALQGLRLRQTREERHADGQRERRPAPAPPSTTNTMSTGRFSAATLTRRRRIRASSGSPRSSVPNSSRSSMPCARRAYGPRRYAVPRTIAGVIDRVPSKAATKNATAARTGVCRRMMSPRSRSSWTRAALVTRSASPLRASRPRSPYWRKAGMTSRP